MVNIGVKSDSEKVKVELVRSATIAATIINMNGGIPLKKPKPDPNYRAARIWDIFPLLKDLQPEKQKEDPEIEMLKASGKTHVRIPIEEYERLKHGR
jgi:hypothetical protein